jgi:hypothetical protein
MYVSVTNSNDTFYSEGFVVRLHKTDGTMWVANFQMGQTNYSEVYNISNSSNLLVIAGGACYFINPNDAKPIAAFGIDYSAAIVTEDEKIVLQGQTHLTIVEPNGTYWHSKNIAIDGLRALKVESNIAYGLSFDPGDELSGWKPFSYDLATKTLTNSGSGKQTSPKPWWKRMWQ